MRKLRITNMAEGLASMQSKIPCRPKGYDKKISKDVVFAWRKYAKHRIKKAGLPFYGFFCYPRKVRDELLFIVWNKDIH